MRSAGSGSANVVEAGDTAGTTDQGVATRLGEQGFKRSDDRVADQCDLPASACGPSIHGVVTECPAVAVPGGYQLHDFIVAQQRLQAAIVVLDEAAICETEDAALADNVDAFRQRKDIGLAALANRHALLRAPCFDRKAMRRHCVRPRQE